MENNKTNLSINDLIAYNIEQIMLLTSISRSKIFLEIKNGNLKTFKGGKRTLATKEALQKWIETLSNVKHN